MDVCLQMSSITTNDDFMHFVHSFPITEIIPNLYLGSKFNIERLEHIPYEITYAVNVGTHHAYPLGDHGIHTYYTFMIDDTEHDLSTVEDNIEHVIDVIDRGLEAGHKVIVHCYSGMNRSALAIVAYLIRKFGLDSIEALLHVRGIRPFVLRNPTFVKYLLYFK